MTRKQRALVAVVCGVFFALVLSGCDGGDGGDDGDGGAGDPAGFPDVRGAYTGTNTWTLSGCSDPTLNGPRMDNITFTISRQNGADVSGSADFATVTEGQVTADGDLTATVTGGVGCCSLQETHIGALTDDTWTSEFSGQYTESGVTCVSEGQVTATRR